MSDAHGRSLTGDATSESETALSYAKSLHAFSAPFFGHVNAGNGAGNVIFSPLSISLCFALVLDGARGETRRELLAALALPDNDAGRRTAAAALTSALSGEPGARLASGAFVDKTLALVPAYLAAVSGQHGAAVRQVDFAGAAEASLAAINGFVAEATGGMIRDILAPSQIGPDTRLVLANALYFKDAWVHPFPKGATGPRPFHVAPDAPRLVSTMEIAKPFKYAKLEDVGAELVELPFRGGASMVLLIPARGTPLDGTLEKLAGGGEPWPARLCALADAAAVTPMTLFLPKFEAELRVELPAILKAMGVVRAFGNADFSGMAAGEGLAITDATHVAKYIVAEEGVEAAAATVVVMSRCAVRAPPKPILTVHADRPFAYALRHAASGALLFLGALRSPPPAPPSERPSVDADVEILPMERLPQPQDGYRSPSLSPRSDGGESPVAARRPRPVGSRRSPIGSPRSDGGDSPVRPVRREPRARPVGGDRSPIGSPGSSPERRR